jgi:microcystin-dependent protein
MRKYIIITTFALIAVLAGNAQNRSGFTWQAVLHNTQGDLWQNERVSLRVSLFVNTNNTPGSLRYCEEHTVTTDEMGVARLQVGRGKWTGGQISYMPTLIDANGGWIRIEVLQTDSVWKEISMRGIYAAPLSEVAYKLHNMEQPVGLIIAYGGDNVPDGWLECNGQVVKRTDYAALFSALGYSGSSETFALPDLRTFLRGIDMAATGRDPDGVRAPKNSQAQALKSHTHSYADQPQSYTAIDGTYDGDGGGYEQGAKDQPSKQTANTGSSVGTRPKNAVVKYIIKAQ